MRLGLAIASRPGPELVFAQAPRPLEDAFRLATEELVNWMVDDFGFSPEGAVLLLGQVARVTLSLRSVTRQECSEARTLVARQYRSRS
jgi:hypothetical protein